MIHFDFSPNNQMADFETQDSKSTVYLGFASDPKINIFSQNTVDIYTKALQKH